MKREPLLRFARFVGGQGESNAAISPSKWLNLNGAGESSCRDASCDTTVLKAAASGYTIKESRHRLS